MLFGFLYDQWLYWTHRWYHAKTKSKIQRYFKRCHLKHHRKYSLYLHPLEWLVALIPGYAFGWWLLKPHIITIYLFWGIFEAARGHGHFLNFPWFPKGFYRVVFLGMGVEGSYHVYHHKKLTTNYGQFLWLADWLFGTMAVKWRKRKWGFKCTQVK